MTILDHDVPIGGAPPEELDLDAVIAVADFRAAPRTFLRRSERAASGSDLTPQCLLPA